MTQNYPMDDHPSSTGWYRPMTLSPPSGWWVICRWQLGAITHFFAPWKQPNIPNRLISLFRMEIFQERGFKFEPLRYIRFYSKSITTQPSYIFLKNNTAQSYVFKIRASNIDIFSATPKNGFIRPYGIVRVTVSQWQSQTSGTEGAVVLKFWYS